ncbi:MAG: polysaccharide deacetylase family protein [Acidimicrobiales bacterium]
MNGDLSRRAFLAGAAAIGLVACSGSSAPRAESSSSTNGSSGPGTTSSGSATSSAAPSGPARFVETGPRGRNEVALTFHTSGDDARISELLDVLAAHKTVMTAFIVGQWLDANLELGRQLHEAGHELANHTYTHPSFATLKPTAMADEVARCRAAIAHIVPDGGVLFRPSGTADGTGTPPAAVLAAAGGGGYPTVLGFDVDPFDYQDPGADAVANRTIAGLHDGAIVSLHFDHPGTITALPRILDAVASAGLTPVTASKLLSS